MVPNEQKQVEHAIDKVVKIRYFRKYYLLYSVAALAVFISLTILISDEEHRSTIGPISDLFSLIFIFFLIKFILATISIFRARKNKNSNRVENLTQKKQHDFKTDFLYDTLKSLVIFAFVLVALAILILLGMSNGV